MSHTSAWVTRLAFVVVLLLVLLAVQDVQGKRWSLPKFKISGRRAPSPPIRPPPPLPRHYAPKYPPLNRPPTNKGGPIGWTVSDLSPQRRYPPRPVSRPRLIPETLPPTLPMDGERTGKQGKRPHAINQRRRLVRLGRRHRHRTTVANTATNQTTTPSTPILSETQNVPEAFNTGLSPNIQPPKTLQSGSVPAPNAASPQDAFSAPGSAEPLGYIPGVVLAHGAAPAQGAAPTQGAASSQGAAPAQFSTTTTPEPEDESLYW